MTQQNKYYTIKEFLGGDDLVKEPLNTQYDYIQLSRKGLSKKQLLFLAKKLSLSLLEISNILPISIRTLQRYDKNQTFSPDVSSRILLIAELILKGSNVFGSIDKFSIWLRHPNTSLANQSPLNLLDTAFGLELIKNELGRIEHGVIS